jgi:hypothetical protein
LSDPVGSKLLGWFGQMMRAPIIRSVQAASSVPLELPPPSLDDVALHLAKRTSSRQEDETLAIAGLFGLDASEYVPLDANQRMAKFLSEYNRGQVPYDILFLDGPKLPVESYTWAPRSFMKRQMNLELKGTYEGAMSVVTQDGLLGRYFCLILKDEWSGEVPPKEYRLKVSENEYLVVLFSRSVDEEEEGERSRGIMCWCCSGRLRRERNSWLLGRGCWGRWWQARMETMCLCLSWSAMCMCLMRIGMRGGMGLLLGIPRRRLRGLF